MPQIVFEEKNCLRAFIDNFLFASGYWFAILTVLTTVYFIPDFLLYQLITAILTFTGNYLSAGVQAIIAVIIRLASGLVTLPLLFAAMVVTWNDLRLRRAHLQVYLDKM